MVNSKAVPKEAMAVTLAVAVATNNRVLRKDTGNSSKDHLGVNLEAIHMRRRSPID
jgi:hypothetical protein